MKVKRTEYERMGNDLVRHQVTINRLRSDLASAEQRVNSLENNVRAEQRERRSAMATMAATTLQGLDLAMLRPNYRGSIPAESDALLTLYGEADGIRALECALTRHEEDA